MSWFTIREKDKQRFSNSRILAEYQQKLTTLSNQELLDTFDSMAGLLLNIRNNREAEDLTANGLDLVAHEMYVRKLKLH